MGVANLKKFSWKSFYFYAVCFICVCAFLIVAYNLIDSLLDIFLRTKNYSNSLNYDLHQVIKSFIYICILFPLYHWHWKQAQKLDA